MSREPLSRRRFLAGGLGALAAAGAAVGWRGGNMAVVPSTIHGADHRVGHLLRGVAGFPPAAERRKFRVVIVGGGVAGLSAAWWLSRNGFDDYILVELERAVGGTAQSGANEISPFPWGAHYVPVPGPGAHYVRLFFEDIGAITGYDGAGEPILAEGVVCGAPESRLFIHGLWQEGVVPRTALTPADEGDSAAFFGALKRFQGAVGADGRPAFTIPARLSSIDPAFRRFDQLTFAALLDSWKIRSPVLRWYIDYCFRDDFGAPSERISAWAGLHYFCARAEGRSGAEGRLMTWPEGNGFLVRELRQRLRGTVETGALVTELVPRETGVAIEVMKPSEDRRFGIEAELVIYAAPRFTVPYVLRTGLETAWAAEARAIEYAPWAVANISLSPPWYGEEPQFAWDNVYYRGKTIGYVVATHQSLARGTGATVLTMYWPLDDTEPELARRVALERSADEWSALFLEELLRFEPELAPRVERVDVWVWGHGMAIPTPGLLDRWARDRAPHPRIVCANADRTGFGLFEEAQYWGIEAAREVLARTEGA